MATVKGTSVIYGIAGGLQTSGGVALTCGAAVTSASGTANSETKRIRGNTGNTVSFVLSNNTTELTATVVCANTVELPEVGSIIKLADFTAAAVNGKYYVTSADEQFSNESEMTLSVNLIKFPGSSFSDL